jgi:hypothetical protein
MERDGVSVQIGWSVMEVDGIRVAKNAAAIADRIGAAIEQCCLCCNVQRATRPVSHTVIRPACAHPSRSAIARASAW